MKFSRVMLVALLCGMQEVQPYEGGEPTPERTEEQLHENKQAEQQQQQKESWAAWTHRQTVGRVQSAAQTVVDTAHAYTVKPVQDAMQAWHEGVTETGDREDDNSSKQSALEPHGNVPLHSQTHVIIPAFNGPESGALHNREISGTSVSGANSGVRHDINLVARDVHHDVTDVESDVGRIARDVFSDFDGGSKAKPALIEEPVSDAQLERADLFSSVLGIIQNVAGMSAGFVQGCTQYIPSFNLEVISDTGSFDLGEIENIETELAMGGERNEAYFADIEARQRAFEALPKIDAVSLAKLTQTKELLGSWTGTALRPILSLVVPTMPKMEALLSEMVTTEKVPVDIEARLQEIIAGVPGGARLAEVSGLVAGSALKGEDSVAMLDAAAKAFPKLLPLANAARDLGIAQKILSKSTDPLTDLRALNKEELKSPLLKKLVESVNNVMTSKENAQIKTAKITAIVKQIGMILFGIALTSVVLMIASDVKDNKTLRSLTQYCLIFDVVALMGGLAYGFKRIAALTHYEPKAVQGKGAQVSAEKSSTENQTAEKPGTEPVEPIVAI